ncbi:MAG: enoyl-CoA hydratase-related protein, partial [Burkholderiales bacterium]
MTDIVTLREGAVQRIQLNRPDKKNAITTAMYAALADAIVAADADRSVRVMLLHGAGDGFTAGNDLHDFLANPPQTGDRPAFRFLHAISHAAKPIVAAVHGVAIGIGTTMLGHCDLVYAAEGTRFHLPFVNLGLCPEGASSVLLPLTAGYQRAAELLMLAEPFDAAKAREIGLVTEVVPGSELLATAAAAAQRLAAKAPQSLRVTKQLLKRALMPQIEAALAAELREFAARLASPEAKE